MNIAEIIVQLSDAVTASGKKVSEIGKDAIFEYLNRVGIPKQKWSEMYEKLKSIHEPQKSSATAIGSKVDYTDNSHNEVKHREPRKKVFSEIKKIAG